jgi:hypothetical protein
MDGAVNLAEDEIWTFDDLAKVLKMPKQSVYWMTTTLSQKRQKNPLPFVVLCGHRRFLRSQIEAWIARSAAKEEGKLQGVGRIKRIVS